MYVQVQDSLAAVVMAAKTGSAAGASAGAEV
jgi:hypothetical protein